MSRNKMWLEVTRAEDIDDDDAKTVSHRGSCISVFKIKGQFYAISDLCTHGHARLSEGYVDGETIECPLHQGLFHIPTGKPLAPPVTEPLNTYPTKVQDGTVYVEVDA